MRRIKPEKRIHGALFSLSIAPAPSGVRFACTVSKKVSGKAVVRNLIKRRCRAAIRECEQAGLQGRALVFTAKKETAAAGYADIKNDVTHLLRKASL